MSEIDPGVASAAGPLADPAAEARRVVGAAQDQGVVLRALGGVAVALLCPSSQRDPLRRSYADIDLATAATGADDVTALMRELGYSPGREFNALHGHRRLHYRDEKNERGVDVFVDEARLCHRIDFRGRLEIMPLTISLADLLLMKLQVVETNEKDMLDVCAILADHELSNDEVGVNAGYLASLAATDWGLWRTVDLVAERTEAFAGELQGFGEATRVAGRLERLREMLAAVPKSRGWRFRARIGERKRWYELPEEA